MVGIRIILTPAFPPPPASVPVGPAFLLPSSSSFPTPRPSSKDTEATGLSLRSPSPSPSSPSDKTGALVAWMQEEERRLCMDVCRLVTSIYDQVPGTPTSK